MTPNAEPVDPPHDTRHGAIMAAGSGSRLGSDRSKALFEVGGLPLVEHVIRQFEAAGIAHVLVAVARGDRELRQYLAELSASGRFTTVTQLAVERTAGTAGALRTLLTAIGPRPSLLSTVDLVAPRLVARDLCNAGAAVGPSVVSVLAVTPQIRGDLPTFVAAGDDGVVTDFGKEVRDAGYLYGNVRWFSGGALAALRSLPEWTTSTRDSVLMRAQLRERPRSIVVRVSNAIFDIDTQGDAIEAETWIARQRISPGTGPLPLRG